jgi:N-hydroxyarylamine O-acetyltransferase
MGDVRLDFDAYAERIGHRGSSAPTVDTLEGIVLGHALRIPFENLDIHLGKAIDIDPAAGFEKLVARRRGGYSFEHNTLLLEMLRQLGFVVRPLAARVMWGLPPVERPRTHMLVEVEIGSRTFLADVGFGGHNLVAPLPFEPGIERTLHGEAFRLKEIPWDGKVLGTPPSFDVEVKLPDGQWASLYRASLEEQRAVDFEMASWFCSTHPASLFVTLKFVSLPEVGARRLLLDRELEVRRNGNVEKTVYPTDQAYRAALRDVFRIDLGPDAVLRW